MTEVAPHTGRRARREAETQLRNELPQEAAGYPSDPAGPTQAYPPGYRAHPGMAAQNGVTGYQPPVPSGYGHDPDEQPTGSMPVVGDGTAPYLRQQQPQYPQGQYQQPQYPQPQYQQPQHPQTRQQPVQQQPVQNRQPSGGYPSKADYAQRAGQPSNRMAAPVPAPAGYPAGAGHPAGHRLDPHQQPPQSGQPAGAGPTVRQRTDHRAAGGSSSRIDPRTIHVNDQGQPDSPMRGRHATQWDQGFDRVVGWTLLGSLIPGSGLIAAGRRTLGAAVLGSCVLVGMAAGGLLLLGDPVTLVSRQLLAHPERFTYAAVGIVTVGVLWALQVIGTHVSLRRFAELTGGQRLLSLLLVNTLVIGGVGGAVFGSKQVLLFEDTLGTIFSGGAPLSAKANRPNTGVSDPWAKTPRMNVLMIGSDAGADRTGIRTDSLILASIDTKTGETVMFSLPRNLEHVPFPAGTQQAADYPDGFVCAEHACMINALWQFGTEHKNTYYKGEKNPGLTATVQGVEQALGLTVDSYAMLSLRGFMQFVDAIGGVTINVARRIPVGGHRGADGIERGVTSYIKPGTQKLNGYQALWFARSRSDSDDFERMRRQRCVIGAVSQQADPQTIALHLPAIMKAAKDNIRTSIPISEIDAWVTLTMRVKKAHVRSLPFTSAVINSSRPNFEKIHALVQKSLQPAQAATASPAASPSGGPSASPSPTTKRTTTHKPTPTQDSTKAVDIKEVC